MDSQSTQNQTYPSSLLATESYVIWLLTPSPTQFSAIFPLAHLFPDKWDCLIFLEHAKLISASVTGLVIPSSWNVLSLIFISPLFLVIQVSAQMLSPPRRVSWLSYLILSSSPISITLFYFFPYSTD